jgi:hypothetical protein
MNPESLNHFPQSSKKSREIVESLPQNESAFQAHSIPLLLKRGYMDSIELKLRRLAEMGIYVEFRPAAQPFALPIKHLARPLFSEILEGRPDHTQIPIHSLDNATDGACPSLEPRERHRCARGALHSRQE